MPFISIHTNTKLDDSKKSKIAEELGKDIEVVPGKNVGNLMVEINDQKYMVYSGSKDKETVYMSIRLHKATEMQVKEQLISLCYSILCRNTGIPEDNIYITIEEFDNWGALGKYL